MREFIKILILPIFPLIAFGKIDEELNNIDDSKITTDKKRGCTDCIIF
jgi:hypothetical protein